MMVLLMVGMYVSGIIPSYVFFTLVVDGSDRPPATLISGVFIIATFLWPLAGLVVLAGVVGEVGVNMQRGLRERLTHDS